MKKKIFSIFLLAALTFYLSINSAMASETEGTIDVGVQTGVEGTVIAVPTVSPAVGTYSSTQSVTLTSADSTGICYTTSGTDPVCASSGTSCTTGTLYSSAISVSSTQTIEAISCYANDNSSSVASFAYTISVAGGGGAGAAPAVTTPETSTGSVTATRSRGGITRVVNPDTSKVEVTLPAYAVAVNANVVITKVAKAAVIASKPLPSGKSVVGSYTYSLAATRSTAGTIIAEFAKNVTVKFTYTNVQVSGLDEAGLTIYWWDETASTWNALTTTVDTANNTAAAETSHFSYFALMGEEEAAVVVDGDMIRNPDAEGMAQFDVYIVKIVPSAGSGQVAKLFKRLILSPHVFESYGHLEWGNVKLVNTATMASYTTSNIVRCWDPDQEVDDPKVYKLTPDGDTGTKQWLNMTATEFMAAGHDWDSIYIINKVDRDAYTTGTPITP